MEGKLYKHYDYTPETRTEQSCCWCRAFDLVQCPERQLYIVLVSKRVLIGTIMLLIQSFLEELINRNKIENDVYGLNFTQVHILNKHLSLLQVTSHVSTISISLSTSTSISSFLFWHCSIRFSPRSRSLIAVMRSTSPDANSIALSVFKERWIIIASKDRSRKCEVAI